MREILFKAKRIDNGEWVEGYYFKAKWHWHEKGIHEDWILVSATQNGGWCNANQKYAIDGKTLCQYTGLTDKNGKKIWENDVVRTRKNVTHTKKLKGYYGVDSDGYPQKIPGYDGESEYHYGCQEECYAEVVFNPSGGYHLRGASVFVDAICNEVIGNIFDNPELVKE